MRRAFALLLLIGLLAALLWWLVGGTGQGPAAEGAGSEVQEADAVPGAALARADSAGEPLRETVSPGLTGEAGADGEGAMLLRVVRAAGGPGVPGVRVLFVDYDAPENEKYRDLSRDHYRDREAAAEPFGRAVLSGPDGTLRLPRTEVSAYFARLEGEYAEGFLDLATPDGTEILLQGDLETRVLVLDQDDHPVAGIPVAWLAWGGDRASEQIRARSGEDGIARLRHLQTRGPPSPSYRHALALMVPGAQEGQVNFDPQNPPAEPVPLRLPACGRVVLEVLDADGRPFPDGTRAFVQRALPAEEKDGWSGYRPQAREEMDAFRSLLRNGRAEFSHVGIGMRLEYGIFYEEGNQYLADESEGLTAAGQELQLVLRQDQAPTRVAGRLLRADRTPIANARVASELLHDGGSMGWVLNTDAEGRFRQFLDESQYAATPERRLWIAHTDPDLTSILAARLTLAEALGPGDHDFGDIVLGGDGLLAAGRVVDGAGQPLAGVLVSIGIVVNGASHNDITLRRGPQRISNVTGSDGRFAFHAGGAPATDWMLHFKRDGYLLGSLTELDGRDDHEIVLKGAGRLSGRLLLDPGIPADLLRLIWLRDGRRESGFSFELSLDKDGGFQTDAAVAGTGLLLISAARPGEELARIADVAVSAEGSADPRLDPLDLRGKLHPHRLRVFDAEGREPGIVALVFEGEKRRFESYCPNPVRLLLPEPGRRITVMAPGSASSSVLLDRPEIEVRLTAGIPVQFKLEGIPWPQENVVLTVHPAFARLGGLDGFEASFDATGVARVTLPEPGRYSIGLQLALLRDGARVRGSYARPGRTPGQEPFEFEVPAGAPNAEVRVEILPEEWERALKMLNDPF